MTENMEHPDDPGDETLVVVLDGGGPFDAFGSRAIDGGETK